MPRFLPLPLCLFVILLIGLPVSSQAQAEALLQPPEAEVLLVGTFHFDDQGLDDYKPEHRLDVFTAERQREIATIVERLAAWRPTHVAVEVQATRQEALDGRYSEYLAGELELGANELHQIGFRLGRKLGLDRLTAVDAPARAYGDRPDSTQWAFANGQASALLRGGWEKKYRELYARDDRAKMTGSLVDHLLYLNSGERLRAGHGHYLTGSMALGDGVEFPGADGVTAWYNRNLRIFANLLRLTASGERTVLLIGAGHVPIIRHAVQASPDLELVELADVFQP